MHGNMGEQGVLEWSDQFITMNYSLFFVLSTVWCWDCQISEEKKAVNPEELYRNENLFWQMISYDCFHGSCQCTAQISQLWS